MNNRKPSPQHTSIVFELLITFIVFCLLLVTSLQSNLQAQSGLFSDEISVEIDLSRSIISNNEIITISYIVQNHTDEDLDFFSIKSSIYRFGQIEDRHFLNFSNLGNNVKRYELKAGETKILTAERFIEFIPGAAWVVDVGVHASTQGESIIAGDGQMIYAFGINMDIDAGSECIGISELREIQLVTRLLIDEDAAKDPGVTIITVGGIDIEIELPETQWEARNLMISCSDLNSNVEFDPFDLPMGVELEILCDQDNEDQGRNTDNVLDECEPIETFRDLCTELGEDDVLCDFPEWVFCYDLRIDDGFTEDTYTIDATDDYEVWQAIENPPGSGMFDDFEDVTDQVGSGNSDQVILNVKTVLPVELLSFELEHQNQHVLIKWKTTNEIDNSHYILKRRLENGRFEFLADITSKANSDNIQTYHYQDQLIKNTDVYYELTQVDFNGTINHLGVRHIKIVSVESRLEVFPNPASDFLNFENEFANHKYTITNIFSQKIEESIINNSSIIVNHLDEGVYILNITDLNNEVEYSTSFIIAR